MARAPALHAGGHRFDSDILHHIEGKEDGNKKRGNFQLRTIDLELI